MPLFGRTSKNRAGEWRFRTVGNQKKIARRRPYETGMHLLLGCRAGRQSYDRVKRAKTDDAGQCKNSGDDDGDNTQRTRQRTVEEKECGDRCNHEANDPVDVTHVLFHGSSNCSWLTNDLYQPDDEANQTRAKQANDKEFQQWRPVFHRGGF